MSHIAIDTDVRLETGQEDGNVPTQEDNDLDNDDIYIVVTVSLSHARIETPIAFTHFYNSFITQSQPTASSSPTASLHSLLFFGRPRLQWVFVAA